MNVKRRPAAAKASARPAQRRRTRKAIVDAAIRLIAEGKTPSVNEVAAAADVSRRTIFLYFPTIDQLLIDATVGALSAAPVDAAIETAAARGEEEGRLEAMVRAIHHVSPEVERLGRTLIRLTVSLDDGGAGPRRGYRRLEWIEKALAPWRRRLGPVKWRRLVCATALVVGWEALIVQRDVCGLSRDEGEELSVWAAQALLDAMLRPGPRRTRYPAS